MKKFETLGKKLSKEQQKVIAGGLQELPPGCLGLDCDCNDNVQCCSNNCGAGSGSSTGKICKVST